MQRLGLAQLGRAAQQLEDPRKRQLARRAVAAARAEPPLLLLVLVGMDFWTRGERAITYVLVALLLLPGFLVWLQPDAHAENTYHG